MEGRIGGAPEVIENLKDTTGRILIDVVHRAAAPCYRSIMHAFQETRGKLAIIGLTASPFPQEWSPTDPHAGARELRELFTQITETIETLDEHPRIKLEAEDVRSQVSWPMGS